MSQDIPKRSRFTAGYLTGLVISYITIRIFFDPDLALVAPLFLIIATLSIAYYNASDQTQDRVEEAIEPIAKPVVLAILTVVDCAKKAVNYMKAEFPVKKPFE